MQTAEGKSLALASKEAEISEQLRDECLRQEVFYSLREAQIVMGLWKNTDSCVGTVRNFVWGRP